MRKCDICGEKVNAIIKVETGVRAESPLPIVETLQMLEKMTKRYREITLCVNCADKIGKYIEQMKEEKRYDSNKICPCD